ncbi:MAG: hypothetical protein QOG10_6352, partial [Kribbellaceae bacterium]|nr:hypothetical protein [Kribbellaceae bacterium]
MWVVVAGQSNGQGDGANRRSDASARLVAVGIAWMTRRAPGTRRGRRASAARSPGPRAGGAPLI